MTNKEILEIAMQQSAIDANCAAEDFKKHNNVIVESQNSPHARKYLDLPLACNLISYGTNIVASIDMQYKEIVEKYINKYPTEHCFETPNMHVINEAFMEHDMKVCFMAEYFLPDVQVIANMDTMRNKDVIRDEDGSYELKILKQSDFKDLYLPQWSNALCEKRKHLDVLGVGAYYRNRLIGFAGASADCDTMWQIGVDILPEMRRKGIASVLTSRLAVEILDRGKVPFYCCAWSNIGSARNAIKSGFRPAWVEMTVKPRVFVDEMNQVIVHSQA